MSKNYALAATKRDGAGKGAARALRRDQRTPAVIYGDKKEPVKIALDTNTINVQYNRGHMFTTVCEMDVEGDKHVVLARDVQLHPVTDNVEHVDFLRVTPKTKIAVNVPIQLINEEESPGLKDGGVLNIVRFEVELVCSAMAIPEVIEVNLAGKEKNDTVTISDASLPEGVKPVIEGRDFAIATISEPRIILDDEPAEGEEGAEGAAEGEETEGGDAEKAEGGEDKGGEDAKE